MRSIHYNVAASLDGFIAGPAGEYDWIVMDPDIDFAAIFARFDTLLMGRRSYEVTMSEGAPAHAGQRIVVVSRTLNPAEHPGVTVVGADLHAEITALKASPGKAIWLWGGGELFRSLVALGLVDRLEISIVPILLGGGVPLFPPPASRAPLEYVGQRLYPKSGIVTLEYDVKR